MKNAKLRTFVPCIFVAGVLAAWLAGCFNPITVVPPKGAENPLAEPFSVDILIGQDTGSRSVAGPDANRIKDDIRNIIQLTVVDDSGNIIAFDEARRKSDSEMAGELRIESIPFGETYHFLLLMGHWERDYEVGDSGNYVYKEDTPPTLLAAGLKQQTVTGSGRVTVVMWPIVVDTAFSSTIGGAAAPGVTNGKPSAVSLLPVDWNVSWTIKRGLDSESGFKDLVNAQKKIPGKESEDALLLKSTPQTLLSSRDPQWINATLTGNSITQDIGTYTSGFENIGTTGSVNFKLEYVPFNLTAAGAWDIVDGDESAFDLGGGGPVWIIRNGVNDLVQNANTDFNSFHNIDNPGMGTANGNGAVRFDVTAKTPGDGSTLVVEDGVFVGPAGSEEPEITFTTDGYEDEAEVWYAVVPKGEAPDISDYTWLDTVAEGDQRETITLDGELADEDCDVYVIVFKDGEVSDPLVINTKEGGGDIDYIWGPYISLYVKSDGSDSDTGDKDHPLETVDAALGKLAAAYAADASWPEKGTGLESPGAIIILDTVEVTQEIAINGATGYPPIVLCDDPEAGDGAPQGKLQAMPAIGNNKRLLGLTNGAKVTLSGGLILAGTGNPADNIGGVSVNSSGTFTMTGGEISGNSSSGGGGVYVSDGTFTMTGGEISGNSAPPSTFGGGVGVYNSTFTMTGGEISGNSSSSYGGGVFVNSIGTFTMDGGEISGNSSPSGGGGVYVTGRFTMTGGEIFGNSSSAAGGVCVNNVSTFTMTGGTIYGYNSAAPNDPYNNKAVNSSGVIQNNKGHAIYVTGGAYHKETTVGPNVQLFYNDPINGTSGW